MLPDDVLLETFKFYLDEDFSEDGWHTLVHVCQRWRYLVFGSPRHLDLNLRCTQTRPVREMLDIWPALPIVIWGDGSPTPGADNITAALERNDRVCKINLWGDLTSILSRSAAVIEKPFPALSSMDLQSSWHYKHVPVLSDPSLGGFAPRLRSIRLLFVPFPGIGKLLSSTSDLVRLNLWDIPASGYISPETMAISLSSLTQLKILCLGFYFPRLRPGLESRHSSPQNRAFLLNLTHFTFQGLSEYLERLVAHIDAPILHSVGMTLFYEHSFDISELPQFINRSEKFRSLNTSKADLGFLEDSVELSLSLQTETAGIMLALSISCFESFWPPWSLSHDFVSSLPLLATSERLDIHVEGDWDQPQLSQLQEVQWLDLLRPFTAVKNLYLSEEVALLVPPALEEVAMLPSLQNIFFEGLQPTGLVQEAIGQLAFARRLSSHPIAVHRWERSQ